MKCLLYIRIDTSLLEHRFCETTRSGIQRGHSGATLRQEVVLSSNNLDGMSVGVTTVGLTRWAHLRGHTRRHTPKMQFDFFSLQLGY